MTATTSSSILAILVEWEEENGFVVGEGARRPRSLSSKKNVDVNLKYKWHPRLTLFVDVINVFDDPIANAFIYVRERTRFVLPAETSNAFGGPSAPRHAAWIVEGDQPNGLANLE